MTTPFEDQVTTEGPDVDDWNRYNNERETEMFCTICNSEVRLNQVSIYSDSYAVMRGDQVCFDCAFWTQAMNADANGRDWFVANGVHYVIGPEEAWVRGFSGAKVQVNFNDGRVVTTTNLWDQGEVSPFFRAQMPDTATITWLL